MTTSVQTTRENDGSIQGRSPRQIAWMRFKNGKVDTMQWVSLGVIVVFGGATLVTQDETFIKWKPSVLYWLMCSTLWVGYFFFKQDSKMFYMRLRYIFFLISSFSARPA